MPATAAAILYFSLTASRCVVSVCTVLAYFTIAEPLPDRWRGRQFGITIPKKVAAGQEGLFAKQMHPAKDEYVEAIARNVPMNKRKLGFGVKNPACRDEFTNTITTERYRERLRREMKSIDSSIASTAAQLGVAEQASTTNADSWSARKTTGRRPQGPPKFVDGAYEDPNLGKSTPRHGTQERNFGTLVPSSMEYGNAVSDLPAEKPKFGLKTASTAFYDIGHLG